MEDFNFASLLIGIIVTFITYMIVPFVLKSKNNGCFDETTAKKYALWNSVIVGAIYMILFLSLSSNISGRVWSAAPAVVYYYINSSYLCKKTKNKNSKKNSQLKTNTLLNNNNFLLIFVLGLIISIGFNISQFNSIKTIKKDNVNLSQKIVSLNDEISNLQNDNEKYKSDILFINNKIGFVIKGDEKYYYNYDCFRKKTQGINSYSYWAYNVEQAETRGFTKRGCCDIFKTQ